MGRERTVMLMRRSEARDQSAIRALVREAGINPLHLHWRNFVVVETGERVIACGQLRPYGDGSVELASLAVSPSYQGVGIGRAIVRTLLHLAPPDVYLMCDAKLRGYYEAFGFVRVGLGDLPREMRGLYRIGLLLTWAIRALTRQPVGVLAMRRTAESG